MDNGAQGACQLAGRRVIAVDLDETLIRSDLLVESVFLLRYQPLLFLKALLRLCAKARLISSA